MLHGSILITGGAGTLGRQIIKRATEEEWDCNITIFSTDAVKHAYVRALWPHINCIVGDVRDPVTVYNAMAGKDIVIHAAAVKHIPESEKNSVDTFQINVEGSINIAQAALQHNTPHVIAISTDKVCHAANAYGATKYLMEKVWQEYSRLNLPTRFHLVRYGNVLESTASVIEMWKRSIEHGQAIRITDPAMTRFWISPNQAVDLILDAIKLETGMILIPKMKSLSIQKLAVYTVGKDEFMRAQATPIRPGEKMHETLLTTEECNYAVESDRYFFLHPTTTPMVDQPISGPYTSANSPELTEDELMELLQND